MADPSGDVMGEAQSALCTSHESTSSGVGFALAAAADGTGDARESATRGAVECVTHIFESEVLRGSRHRVRVWSIGLARAGDGRVDAAVDDLVEQVGGRGGSSGVGWA